MRTIPTLLAVGLVALVTPLEAQDFRWTGQLAAGQEVEIKGVNGSIEAMPARGNEIEVTAVKRARRDDPESVTIEVVEHAGGVTICAVYPESGRDRRPNECAPGAEGRLNSHDNDVSVHFTVRVPANLRFTGKTVNGDVEVTDLGNDVEVMTVNGDVSVSTSGRAAARTVNGGINVTMGRADWTGTHEFHTVNGGITVHLPADFSAEIEAQTVNGDIVTDFPLTVTGRIGMRRLRGTIGSGGRTLELQTVNGSIKLRRAGGS